MKQYTTNLYLILSLFLFSCVSMTGYSQPGSDCSSALSFGVVNSPNISGYIISHQEIWYYFTVPTGNTDDVIVSLCNSNFNTIVGVWADCSDFVNYNANGSVAYNNNFCGLQSEAVMSTPAAGTYYVAVWGQGNSSGYYELSIASQTVTNPCLADADFSYQLDSATTYTFQTNYQNYTFSGYIVTWDFDDGTTASNLDVVQHTFAAPGTYEVSCEVVDPNNPQCYDEEDHTIVVGISQPGSECSTAILYGAVNDSTISGNIVPHQEIWYYFTVPTGNTDDVVVSLCNSNFNTIVGVWADCSDFVNYNANGSVVYNNNFCGLQSEAVMSTPAAGTYYVAVWGQGNSSGYYELSITSQPVTNPCLADAGFSYNDNGNLNIDFSLTGIINPNDFTVNWDFGDGSSGTGLFVSHVYAAAGIFNVICSVYDINDTTCFDSDTSEITIGNSVICPWQYSITGSNHTILIHQSASITINGISIDDGDFIGVFFDSLGTLKCGGYTQYDSQAGNLVVTAWGESFGYQGFAPGEEFNWKIFQFSTGQSFDAIANYDLLNFPDSSAFIHNGMSGITGLQANLVSAQTIGLNNGWNFFSTYIQPTFPQCDSIFSDILANVAIVKSYSGLVYWPNWSVNSIGNITFEEGYQIKINNQENLIIEGTIVQPENTPVPIPAGWSFLPYLRQNSAPIVEMLSPVISNVVIVKDENGWIYWPLYGVNEIGILEPGDGYQILMSNSVIFTYPPNTN